MSITSLASLNVTAAVLPAAGTAFTTTARGFWLVSEGFGPGECAYLFGAGPSGAFRQMSNDGGAITVGASPNTIYVDAPAGTYRVGKTATAASVYVGWDQE